MVVETPYGRGGVKAARRGEDGVIAVQLPFGVAYVHHKNVVFVDENPVKSAGRVSSPKHQAKQGLYAQLSEKRHTGASSESDSAFGRSSVLQSVLKATARKAASSSRGVDAILFQ